MIFRGQGALVADRQTFDGQRQRDALTAFQKAAGMDATMGARAVGLSYPQYNRYLWGRVPLRTDQIPSFAAAYGITKAELSQALGLFDDADLPSLCQRAREAVGPVGIEGGEDGINEMARVLNALSPADQDRVLRQVAEATAPYRTAPDD